MADDKKPYGNVTYADPKNGKYPIDTEAHVRAAWSYINMPKNHEGYSSDELAKIKGRIKAAAKKFGIEIQDDTKSEDRSLMTSPVETRSQGVHLDNVDFGQRIITVLAVPYEQPTNIIFRGEPWAEVFSRSAFNGIESLTRKIPATAALEIPAPDHRGGRVVGKVISSDPHGSNGLVSDIKISRTEYGDETLELARDDALSVSVGFMVKNPRMDQELDRYKKLRRVNRAFLDHLAFVGQPAYEGAGVLSMRGEDQIVDEEQEPFAKTPRMDAFLADPTLQWASDYLKSRRS